MFEEEHNKKYKKIFRIQPFRKDGMRRNWEMQEKYKVQYEYM
jgi:hypothetical protein